MKGLYKEIYVRLSNINKLSIHMYRELVSIYGGDIVHTVIEHMIEENEKNIFKFDCYIELMIADLENTSFRTLLDIYMKDVGMTRLLTPTENMEYSNEAYEIVKELRGIFETLDCEYVKNRNGVIFNSIVDEVEFYLKECKEQEIIDKLKELGNRYIYVRNKLVEGNLRAVVAALKPFYRDNDSFIEFVQYGNIGLMKAVEKYDPSFNTSFVTYAYYWIKQTLRNAIKAQFDAAASVSYYAITKNNIRLKVINRLSNQLGRMPTENEVASYMGISDKKLETIEHAFYDKISLHSTIWDVSSDLVLVDTIRDNKVNIEESVCNKIFCQQLLEMLKNNLTEKQLQVLIYRIGLNGTPLTFQQISTIMGISRQRVKQCEKTALKKSKRFVSENNIKLY